MEHQVAQSPLPLSKRYPAVARWGKRSAIKPLEINTWAHVKQSQICNVETPRPCLRRWFWKCVYKSFQSRCDGLNRGTAPRIRAKLIPGSKWDYICLLFDSEWPLEKQGMILLSYFAATSKTYSIQCLSALASLRTRGQDEGTDCHRLCGCSQGK